MFPVLGVVRLVWLDSEIVHRKRISRGGKLVGKVRSSFKILDVLSNIFSAAQNLLVDAQI